MVRIASLRYFAYSNCSRAKPASGEPCVLREKVITNTGAVLITLLQRHLLNVVKSGDVFHLTLNLEFPFSGRGSW